MRPESARPKRELPRERERRGAIAMHRNYPCDNLRLTPLAHCLESDDAASASPEYAECVIREAVSRGSAGRQHRRRMMFRSFSRRVEISRSAPRDVGW